MQTTTRKVIVDQIKVDLEENISVVSGYETDLVEARCGIYVWEDFPLKPVISYWLYRDEIEEHLMGGAKIRLGNFYVYCYTNTDGLTDTSNIYNIVDDLEKFLKSSHNTFYEDTIIGDSNIYTGGSQDKAGLSITEMQIRYKQ